MITIYTILVKNTNELISSQVERIMCRSKLVDNLHFLVSPTYKEIDMSDFSVTMEYLTPVSKTYKTESLTVSEELYKDMLEYKLPFDTALTKEPGNIELSLTFTKVEMKSDGKMKQYVRKTSPCSIYIVPLESWSEIIPDEALNVIDQRLIKQDALMQQLIDLVNSFDDTKADNLSLKDNILQLLSGDKPIGNEINLSNVQHPDSDKNIEIVNF
mgnify:CR=1 FL=1